MVPGSARRPVGARARVLLLRRRDSRRLRVVARPPHAAEAQLAERRSCTSASREVLRRYLELGLDGWRIDVANMVGRYRELDLNRDVSKWTREQVGDALLIAEHGHDFRPDLDGARLARRHELLRLPAPALDVAPARRPRAGAAAAVLGHRRRRPPARRRRLGRCAAALPRRRALGVGAPLVEPARQPRHRALPHDRRRVRPPPRRRRPADDAARRADALRRRRARARGRLGRGRAPDDAVGSPRVVGRAPSSTRRAPSRTCGGRCPRSRAAGSASSTSAPTRSPSCARRETSGCSCSPRARRTRRSSRRSRTSRRSTASDAPDGVLPSHGPAFHIWRIG